MVTPTRPRPKGPPKKSIMMYDDWGTDYVQKIRVGQSKKRLKNPKKYLQEHKDASGANLAKDIFVYEDDDGIAAFYYSPMVPVCMYSKKNKTLKDYEDPASDNYDPLRVIKERMALEEPNALQAI